MESGVKKMAKFGLNFYLLIALLLIELAVFSFFVILYIRKRMPSFQALIASMFFFILSNGLLLTSVIFEALELPEIRSFEFLQGLFGAAGLVAIVIFLEIFENGLSFVQRSATSSIFILVVGAFKGARAFFNPEIPGIGPDVGNFIAFIAPIMYILVGGFYLNTIKRMNERVRFENQKKKIRKVRTGIYLTFILPKFIIGLIVSLPVFAAILFENFDINIVLSQEIIFDIIINLLQVTGLVILSLPIIFSQSVFFMQSRKVSRLIVINKDGTSVFEFFFEHKLDLCDQNMLEEAFEAISTIMANQGISCQELKSMNFGDIQLMIEIRNNFAALLIVDRPTLFLNKALETFANDLQNIYPDEAELNQIKTQKLKFTAEKMIQKNFGLEQEEFEQIKQIVREGFDRVGGEYSQTRSEEGAEVKLLPDFMKRLPTGARVLDAGCGAGEPITRILSEKFKVVGVDISKKQIDAARELLPYCEFVWQDMTTLTYPDEYFDGIVSYYAIPHIPREEHIGILRNFYRMMKKGGLALLCFGTDDTPGTVIDDFLGVKMYWSSFDAGTNLEMMKSVGFHVVWLKLIFDDISNEQHIFVLAQKPNEELLEEIIEVGKLKEKEKEDSEERSSQN